MPNNAIRNYYLYLIVDGDEIEIMHDTLYNIDKFTTYFKGNDELIEFILPTNFNINNGSIVLKSSRKNIVEVAYKKSKMVTYEFGINENFETFLVKNIPNALFKLCNELIKKRVSRNFSINGIDKLELNSIYLWEDDFKYELENMDTNKKEKEIYLSQKKKFDEINKDVILTRILNDLLLVIRLREKTEIEMFLRKDYVEQKSDYMKRTNLETIIIDNLKKYISNYRNYRDFYLISNYQYNSKTNASTLNKKLYEQENFVYKKMNEINKILSSYKDFSDENEENEKTFKDLEVDYKENLKEELNLAIEKGDEEHVSEIMDELSRYTEENEHQAFVRKLNL